MRGKRLVINGRFLSVHATGVHRVGMELVRQLDRRAGEIAEIFGSAPAILAPKDARTDHDLRDMPIQRNSLLTGQPWEQAELPWRSGRDLLLSLCNLSPIGHRNAITMFHDAQTFSTPDSYGSAFRRFYQFVQPRIGHRVRRILTVSDHSARELEHWKVAPAERIRVIHNGVDHVLAVAPDLAAFRRLGLQAGRYVLALASTQTHKNIQVLLKAFADPSLADVQLVLFGSTSAEQMAAAGLLLPSNAIAAGRLSDAELYGLMQQALCFAMPSLTEGFGLPPLEAMLLGCPAIATRYGALPEVCGEAALYAGATAPEEWVQAIRLLRDDPEARARLIAEGREQAGRFTWARAGDQLMAVIREVVDENASGRRPPGGR